MNTNGHLMYGGSGASNMVAKIISSNQRCFNLNKMAHPSANLQRRYGDGSVEIDDSYWRMAPPPQRWDGGVSRANQLMPPPALSPQISDYGFSSPPPSPSPIRFIPQLPEPPPPPKPQLPKSQFMQLTPQTSIPVQNLQLQQNPTLPMAIAPTNVREDFQPPAPKLSKKKLKSTNEIKDYGDDRNGKYFRPQNLLVPNTSHTTGFLNVLDKFNDDVRNGKDGNADLVKQRYNEFVKTYNDLILNLDNQKARIKKYLKTLNDETEIKQAKGQLEQVRAEYKYPQMNLERVQKRYQQFKTMLKKK